MTLDDLHIRLQEYGLEVLSSYEPNFDITVLRFNHIRNQSALDEDRLHLVVKIVGQRLLLTIRSNGHSLRWPRQDEEFANSNRIYFSSGRYFSVTNDNYASFFDSELTEVLSYLKNCI